MQSSPGVLSLNMPDEEAAPGFRNGSFTAETESTFECIFPWPKFMEQIFHATISSTTSREVGEQKRRDCVEPPKDLSRIQEFARRTEGDGLDLYFSGFWELQRANILRIYSELIKHQDICRATASAPDETTRVLLRDYATAIRDYQFFKTIPPTDMSTDGSNTSTTTFSDGRYRKTSSRERKILERYLYISNKNKKIIEHDPIRDFLNAVLPKRLTWSAEQKNHQNELYESGKAPDTINSFVDRLARFLVAFSAGAVLVVPMLVMAIRPSQAKSLVTTSAAVVLFAMALSLGIRTTNENTFAATATYAAVLIVFVGTNNS